MNLDKMINMMLIKLSQNENVFYMEKRSYYDDKISKSFFVKIGDKKEEFKTKRELLIYLSNVR